VAAKFPREKNDLAHFHKFDPPIAGRVAVYGMLNLGFLALLWRTGDGGEGRESVEVAHTH